MGRTEVGSQASFGCAGGSRGSIVGSVVTVEKGRRPKVVEVAVGRSEGRCPSFSLLGILVLL